MQVRKDKKKFPSLYENIPHGQSPNTELSSFMYRQTPTASSPLHRQSSDYYILQTNQTKKHKYDNNINKAEHGYNIVMHAVNKHPVNNILRLNKVL